MATATRCCSTTRATFSAATTSRQGGVTFCPCGFTQGPHPKALQAAWQARKPVTDECAVMVDTRDGLKVGDPPAGVEFEGCEDGWRTPPPSPAAG